MIECSCLVVIPIFNESENIEKVVKEVKKYFSNILIVDDGSDDGSKEILSKLQVE